MKIKSNFLLFLSMLFFLTGCDLFDHISKKNYLFVEEDQEEITEIEFSRFSDDAFWGKYWTFDTVDGSCYYVWYHNGDGSGDPGPIGVRTGISVTYPPDPPGDDWYYLVDSTVTAITSVAGAKVSATNTSGTYIYLTLIQKVIGPCGDATAGSLGSAVTIRIKQQGQYGE